MPYVVKAVRVRGRWQVKNCPHCGRPHNTKRAGLQRTRCGNEYLVVFSGTPMTVRHRSTPVNDEGEPHQDPPSTSPEGINT